MEEKFLHHIWQHSGFNFLDMKTSDGIPVIVRDPGKLNLNQGPDFLNAKIRLGYLEFAGDVEIHVSSAQWYEHRHHLDQRYNSVVLHVVFHSDGKLVKRKDQTIIPEFSLFGRINNSMELKYHSLLLSQTRIPCEPHLPYLNHATAIEFSIKLGIERIAEKSERFRKRLNETRQDWEQVLWEEIAASLAGPVNQSSFRLLAQALPYKLLRKYCASRLKLEALIFGVSGMLTGLHESDSYIRLLKKEWQHLAALHQIKSIFEPFLFFRMRPGSFPTIRISQLAALVTKYPVLTELLLHNQAPKFLKTKLEVSRYWENHTRFGEPANVKSSTPGTEFMNLLLINTIFPLSWLYFSFHGRDNQTQMMIDRISSLPPEKNSIINIFSKYGIKPLNALQSQGLIELKKYWCSEKRCLDCEIGKAIIGTRISEK